MSWLKLLLSALVSPVAAAYYLGTGESAIPIVQPDVTGGPITLRPDNPVDGSSPDSDVWASAWLAGLAATGAVVVASPVLYKAYTSRLRGKRAKRASIIGQGLDDASMRATTLASAFLPAAGLPIAYITVQAMEKQGIITKGLGDAVQTLIAAGAVAPAIGGVLSFAGKAVK